jgi:hypothetical protein
MTNEDLNFPSKKNEDLNKYILIKLVIDSYVDVIISLELLESDPI